MAINEYAARYYTQDAMPAYEATMKEARDNGYGVSVTTVTHQWTNPGLEIYKQRAVLEAALTLPRLKGETDGSFISRILEDADEHASRAAAIGTAVHDHLEYYIEWGFEDQIALPDQVAESVRLLLQWIDEVQLEGHTEVPFYHRYGFGGKRDFIGTAILDKSEGRIPVVIDWKTQMVREALQNGEPQMKFYPNWAQQLSAYRLDTEVPRGNCINIAISTNQEIPGFKVKRWVEHHKRWTDIDRAEKAFLSMLKTWQLIHNFPVYDEQE